MQRFPRYVLAAAVLLLSSTMYADLIGTKVLGKLGYDLSDPYDYLFQLYAPESVTTYRGSTSIPGEYGNANAYSTLEQPGPLVTISDPQVEFGVILLSLKPDFTDYHQLIDNALITADFSGDMLRLRYSCIYALPGQSPGSPESECSAGGSWYFADSAFTGVELLSDTLGVHYSFADSALKVQTDQSQEIRSGETLEADFRIATASSVTPEPGTFALLGTGAVGLAGVLRRRAGMIK